MSVESIRSEIAEYQKKIDKYTTIQSKVSALSAPLSNCQKSTETLNGYTKYVVVNGEAIDGGAIDNIVNKNLATISEYIAEMVAQGTQLIEKYTNLKAEAEKRLEELLAEIERQKQAANNYTYDQSTTKKINIPKRSINQLK